MRFIVRVRHTPPRTFYPDWSFFFLAPTSLASAPTRPSRPQPLHASKRTARPRTWHQPSNCSKRSVVCSACLLNPGSPLYSPLTFSGSSSSNSSSTATTPSSTSSHSSSASSSSTAKPNGAVYDQVPFLNGAIALATVALGGALFM